MIASLALLLAAAITVDKAAHSVTLSVKATEVAADTTIEFPFVGPNSDRAYESLFVTEAPIADIAKAFDEAGIPRGRPVGAGTCRFWPVGKRITITPSIWDFTKDNRAEAKLPIVYTGGACDAKGVPVAHASMPSALMAFYGLDQGFLLLDDAIDQSAVYGRFTSNGKAKKGERYTFTFAWDGKSGSESRVLKLEPGKVKDAIASLRGAKTDLDVQPDFSPVLSVAEARSAASALSVIDSRTVKINGFSEGQFFYRGFLPDEKWRVRAKRLTQPLEVRVSATNVTYTVVHENWDVEGIDPELTPKEVALQEACKTFKGNACLFYVTKDIKLERLYALMKELPKTIVNWYVFVD